MNTAEEMRTYARDLRCRRTLSDHAWYCLGYIYGIKSFTGPELRRLALLFAAEVTDDAHNTRAVA